MVIQMSAWHYCRNGQQFGPISEAGLKTLVANGDLEDSTLVWSKGMSEWVRIRNLPEPVSSASTPLRQPAAARKPPPKKSIRKTILEVIGGWPKR